MSGRSVAVWKGGQQSLGIVVCLTKQLMSGRPWASRVEAGADCRLFPEVGSIAFDRLRASVMILGICCLVLVIGLWCGSIRLSPPARERIRGLRWVVFRVSWPLLAAAPWPSPQRALCAHSNALRWIGISSPDKK